MPASILAEAGSVGAHPDSAGLATTSHPSPAHGAGAYRLPHGVVVVAFTVFLLVLATTSQGAFAVSRWAPLGLFSLAVLIGSRLVRATVVPWSPALRLALCGIWGLAGWSMLSMLWAASSADAWQAANRTLLYAAIATLPFVIPVARRSLVLAGWSIPIGIGLIAVYTLIGLLHEGASLFLAGRLNAPVNYRNATALLFALAFWPLIVACATRSYRRGVRAAALSMATLCLGLAFLTQSRGILLGLAGGGCLALAVGPDRVRRAWMSILAVAGVALASPWLLRPFHAYDGGNGSVSAHSITVAAVGLAALAAVAFALGLAIALFDRGLRVGSPRMRQIRPAARIGLLALVCIAVAAGALAVGNPVTFARHKWDEFHELNIATPTTTRYVTVGGQRYDLWRVALKEFKSAPLLGVGSENYSFGYYRYRATNRNLSDPHSLFFALLSENGIVGVALFALFLGGMAAVLRRGWRSLDPAGRRHAIAPASAAVVFLAQSQVDWMWLIPGLSAIAVLALSISAAQAEISAQEDGAPPAARKSPQGLARIARPAALSGLAAATLSMLALLLSEAYIQKARELTTGPRAELSAARTAATLDPWSVTPRYLEASAYETLGERQRAYSELRDALSLEPDNSASWGVLGDFEVRGGDLAAARRDYRRALALNPLDSGLAQLARIGERGGAPASGL